MLASEILRRVVVGPDDTTFAVKPIAAPFGVSGALDIGGDLTQRGQPLPVVLTTVEIDFATLGAYLFSATTIPGKVFIPVVNANFVRVRLTAAVGAQTTAPLGTIGNNAATFNNFTGAAPVSLVSAGIFAGGVGTQSATAASLAQSVPAELTTPMEVLVTTAGVGTGGYVCKGHLYIPGYLVDV